MIAGHHLDTDPGQAGIQPIELSYTNPFSNIQYNPFTNRIYVSCVGSWGVNDGGVEIKDKKRSEPQQGDIVYWPVEE